MLEPCKEEILRTRRYCSKRPAESSGETPTFISPMALEAVQRIDALFAIEREINGLSADERKAARQNQSVSAPRQSLRLGCAMNAPNFRAITM